MLKDFLSKNRIRLFVALTLLLALFNVYCYRRHFEEHIKLRTYSASQQLLYNPAFQEEQYGADSLIREAVRGKLVAVPRKLRPYKEYDSYGKMHEEGNPFSARYFWENNYTKYFMEYASAVTVDTALPDLYELKEKPLSDTVRADFTLLGPGNDMMRYVHMADHTDEETSTQFFYTWYYTVEPYHPAEEALMIRICTEGLEEDDELVALWDESENLYLMSRTYYDSRIADGYKEENVSSGNVTGDNG